MRKLMWFAVGFTGACAAGVYLLSDWYLLLIAAFCLVGLVALLKIPSAFAKKTLCVLIGCTVGFLWLWGFDCVYLSPVRNLDGQTQMMSIEVTDYSRPTEQGIRAEGRTEIAGKCYAVQLYFNEGTSLSPGDRVEGAFRLRFTHDGKEDPTFHRGDGIFLLCYPKGEHTVTHDIRTTVRQKVAIWRNKILSWLEALFPDDTEGFAKALLLGDTTSLNFSDKWAMKAAGIYHVVAVSGMHVSILFALVSLVCVKRRGLLALIGLPVLFLFAALAGFSPSIVRACIMQALLVIALLCNKEYDPPTALAAAVLTILAINPISITSISLQLSAGCMVGIFLFTQRIQGYFYGKIPARLQKGKSPKARLVRWLIGSVSMTLGAISLTTPLSALYFGSVSIVGILTNLLILWAVSLIFYAILAASLLGLIWLPLGTAIGWAISWVIRILLWVVNMISKLPVAAVYTSSIYIVAWLIFGYILLTVFLKTKKKHPAIFAICLSAGLVGALLCSWLEPRLDDFRITAIDVGQGQCLLLQNEGEYYMVDCGGDSGDMAADEAIKLLYSQGVFHLDGLIITHYDADHAAGALQLMSRVKVDTLYLPVFDGQSSTRDDLKEAYSNKIHWVRDDVHIEDADITIYASGQTQDENESSLCILFQPESCDILITGDRSEKGEAELMQHTDLPDLEILIAGHHGSRTSTSWELLDETRPEIVIISVGADNRYGHPTWETLERLKLFGCNVYRTDLEGTIIFRG